MKIEVDSHSDAFMLFESLNNRGVPLSAIDLIKNKILAELEKQQQLSPHESFEQWNEIINNLPDYSIQERFLRQYYNAFKHDKDAVKVGSFTRATRSNLIKIYETLIERNPVQIFRELREKSLLYRNLVNPETIEDDELFLALQNELRDIVNVQAAPAYILLLYLFADAERYDVRFYREVIDFLVRYFIRRNLTDFPNTRNLDQIFMDLIEAIEREENVIPATFITEFLSDKERMSNIATFEEKLRGDVYELNVDATRFILSKIEERNGSKEIHVDFWKRDNSGKLIWTIEHIFPEGRNIPDAWVEMMAGGDREQAEQLQADHVHKLGNLTLTGYNQYLSNFDFQKKRDRKNQAGIHIGYRNRLFLNAALAQKEQWTTPDIEERTEQLVSAALEVFRTDYD